MRAAEYRLGDICEITSSKRIFYNEYVDSGIPFWRSKEVIMQERGEQLDDLLYISEERYAELAPFGYPAKGDLLLTSVGTIGSVYRVKENDRFYFKDGNLTWFRRFDSAVVNSAYLELLIRSDFGQGLLKSVLIGSSQKALTISALKNLLIPLPSLTVQNAILQIISPCNDLIDNDRRQIELLEEAARRLYKEWFVDMRFPGHEDVKFADGLPEGWMKGRLSEFAEFKRGKVITAKQAKPGNVPVVAGGLSPAYYHNASNAVAPVITVSGSGANAGYTALYGQDIWASDCSFLDSTKTDFIYFVYLTVKELGRGFKHLQRGSAQPHVYPSHINELEFVPPSDEKLKEFEEIVECMFRETRALEAQIKHLQEARDRLLPKLISGEVEV